MEFVGWRELGLYLGFDLPASSEYTGVSRFVGWEYVAPDGLGLVTDGGIGIGSSLSDARAAYGDRLQIPSEPDECVGDWSYLILSPAGDVQIFGSLDRAPTDDARIVDAHGGQGVGC